MEIDESIESYLQAKETHRQGLTQQAGECSNTTPLHSDPTQFPAVHNSSQQHDKKSLNQEERSSPQDSNTKSKKRLNKKKEGML